MNGSRVAGESKRAAHLGRGVCMAAVVLGLLAPGAVAFTSTSAAAEAAAAAAPSAQLPSLPANGELSFVVSDFAPTAVPGKDACPHGTENMEIDNFISTLSPAERTRLLKPENQPELDKRRIEYGFSPDHKLNVCTNYDKFEHPLYHGVQNKISYGVNLDGAASDKNPTDPYVCPHEKFTSPSGEAGVDNQMYRVMACERNVRAADGSVSPEVQIAWTQWLLSDYTFVIVLRNVHSFVNDDNVEVVLASSLDLPYADTQKNFIRDASYQVTPTPRYRAILHGHIHDGVLTTDPKDVVLESIRRELGVPAPEGRGDWDFARSRLKLTIKPDGTLDGFIGGYVPLTMLLQTPIGGGIGSFINANIDCNSQYRTLQAMADGDRDPTTGKCNRISFAMHMSAVPAYVYDHPVQEKTAAAR